jgi:hypothetical protein
VAQLEHADLRAGCLSQLGSGGDTPLRSVLVDRFGKIL